MSFEDYLKKNLFGMAKDGKSALLDELKKMPPLSALNPVQYAKRVGLSVGFFTGKTESIDYVERIPPKNLVDA